MVVPRITKVEFNRTGLHKKFAKKAKSFIKVTGMSISADNEVNVNGTHGQLPTNWHGTLDDNGDGTFQTAELDVIHEEQGKSSGGHFGGNEDVTVNVTNSTDSSDPYPTTTPVVP